MVLLNKFYRYTHTYNQSTINNILRFLADTTTEEPPINGSCFDIKLVTKTWASEISWSIGACESSGPYEDNKVYEQKCCLGAGDHSVNCKDSYGDGWNYAYLVILHSAKTYCKDFKHGKLKQESISGKITHFKYFIFGTTFYLSCYYEYISVIFFRMCG